MRGYSDRHEVIKGRIRGWLDDLYLSQERASFHAEVPAGGMRFVYQLSSAWCIEVWITGVYGDPGCFKYFNLSGRLIHKSSENESVKGATEEGGNASFDCLIETEGAFWADGKIGKAQIGT